MLIAAVCAVPKDRVEENVRRRHPAGAAHRWCRTRGRDGEVCRHRHGERPAAARIDAKSLANDGTEQEIVLLPAKPAGLHIAGEMAAIADKGPVDEVAVVIPQRYEHAGKIDMSPRLRKIPRGGKVGCEALGDIALLRGARTSARDAVADR